MSNTPVSNFSELPLKPQLLRAIAEMGFESPSPIQAQALPLLLQDPTDFLGLAGTGTGKTAAFAIPLLNRIDPKMRTVQALILCPTRELAMQVAGQITLLGKHLGIQVATVYGGAPFGDQVRALRSGAQIVVGTPGRVIDHLERKTLELGDVDTLILDEADEMFSMGFKDELDKIIAGISEEANTWLFSATMSADVRRVVTSKLRDPKTVQVNRAAMLSSGVEQLFYRCQENEKAEMICKLIEAADDFYGLIFCQTKALVADLTRFMLDRGYKVDCLHGDMDQNSRERTMQAFRDKKLQVLVCTDVAARGLDVKDITHVVNYSLPREMESYVHRIGRTARSGKTGIVMNLLTFSHRHLLGRIEQHTKVRMTEGFVPTKREVAAKKVARMMPALLEQPNASRVLEVMGADFLETLATMTPEDVAARFIVMMLPDIFSGDESRKTKKATKAGSLVASSAISAPAPIPPAPLIQAVTPEPVAVQMTAPVQVTPPLQAAAAVSETETSPVPETLISPVSVAEAPAASSASLTSKVDLFGDETRPRAESPFEGRSVPSSGKSFGSRSVPGRRPMSSGPRPAFGPHSGGGLPPRSDRAIVRTEGPVSSVRATRVARPEASSRPGGVAPTAPIARVPRNRLYERPAAPPNFAKPPKHEPGLAMTAREGETGGLNRRARRAALYGRPVDGATETSAKT